MTFVKGGTFRFLSLWRCNDTDAATHCETMVHSNSFLYFPNSLFPTSSRDAEVLTTCPLRHIISHQACMSGGKIWRNGVCHYLMERFSVFVIFLAKRS